MYTINYRLEALGLYKFVRGFGWAYNRGGGRLYADGKKRFEMSNSTVDRRIM